MHKLAMAVAISILIAAPASAACKDPKYIEHARTKNDPGAKFASIVLLPATAVMAAITQPLRLLPGGKKHAKTTLCVVKSQLKNVVE